MAVYFTFCSFFLLHLLILLGAQSDGAVEIQGETVGKPRDHSNAHEEMRIEQIHSHSSSSTHMHHMDPSVIVFFFLEDLKLGNTIPIYFPRRDTQASPRILSKEEADSIPFSSHELHTLLKQFSFSQGSPQAIAMEDTLRECERKPIKGETKICITSRESMLEFTRMIFGLKTQIKAVATTHLRQTNTLLQKYIVMGVQEIPAPKLVPCHTMPYPYAVFFCHYMGSPSRVFSVSLSGEENGDKVEAIAVCHMDTSQWSPNHISFQLLGIEPGTSPVCHFFPSDNFVWLPTSDLKEA